LGDEHGDGYSGSSDGDATDREGEAAPTDLRCDLLTDRWDLTFDLSDVIVSDRL
jgi:hypothetical protein